MYKYKELFDLSIFPVSSKCYCSDNKKVLGKMKDEYVGKSILKFVGLKFKMYSILHESNNEKITSKGHNGFIESRMRRMRRIGSKNHNLGTNETNKRSLSFFGDKLYILKNGTNTLAVKHLDSIANVNNKKA